MSATARQAQDQPGLAERLGIKPGQVVQELGYDDDCDEQLREAIASLQDVELVDEDYDDVVDVVLLWWRDGDGDLVDALMDALTPLADGGYIWLLTPKAGRPGHVEPTDIGESAPTAGLSQTSSVSAARDWLGTRLVAPKAAAEGRSGCTLVMGPRRADYSCAKVCWRPGPGGRLGLSAGGKEPSRWQLRLASRRPTSS